MSARTIVWLELWFFIGLPILGEVVYAKLGWTGAFFYLILYGIWLWELFAFFHYRFCRQEEFVQVLETAAATQMPIEAALKAYLDDRPRDAWYHVWLEVLLLFVYPGYYRIHLKRSFDARLARVLALLENGIPLDEACRSVPGVVSRSTALALTVGQFSGRLTQTLQRLPDRRLATQFLDWAPRLWYPWMILSVLIVIVTFQLIFVVPKYQKIFADLKLDLPVVTDTFINTSKWLIFYWAAPVGALALLSLINVLLFSSYAKWYFPVVGRLYRMHARGQFLQTLGLMLESGRPLPEILDHVTDTKSLPKVVQVRAHLLAADVSQGQPLADRLVAHGLATRSMQPLIRAAERALNLPWALQELGDSLIRHSTRLSYRLMMVFFPLAIFACACLVAFVALAMFSPLIAIMEGLHGK